MSLVSDFFKPVPSIEGISEADYESLRHYINTLEAIARLIDLSYYIIDYKKREFIYVSGHPLFLAGYETAEVKKLGYDFFGLAVPPEDLNMLLEINEKGFEFYYHLPAGRRPKGYISYDFRLKHKNGSTILINHKLTPVILNEEGDLWISLCLVTLSTARKPGNMNIFMQDEGVKYHYSFRTKKFQAIKNQSLTATEKQVIQLLSMGNSSRQIAEQLSVSENTVKFHKKNVFRKLGVKNSNEAVYLSTIQK